MMHSSSGVADIVRLVTKIGPDVGEISRRLGIFKETVRYRYKHLLEKGFAVQVAPNYERLGLRRIVGTVDFAPEFKPYAEAILSTMGKFCYLGSYARTVPAGTYVLHVNAPKEYSNEWIRFADALKENGIFRSVEFFAFDSFRDVPMRAELFNFDTGTWDYEWTNARKPYPEEVLYETPSENRFDEVDLKVIEQLQHDANKSFTDVQQELQMNYKTLTWHFRNHIQAHGLLKSYRVNWMGTRYDLEPDGAMHNRHKYVLVDLLVRDITPEERAQLIGRLNSIPFIWCEAVGHHHYAQLPFPTEMISEGLGFLEETLSPVMDRATWTIEDTTHALFFTIEPSLYDSERRRWRFDRQNMMARFENLRLEITRRGPTKARELLQTIRVNPSHSRSVGET